MTSQRDKRDASPLPGAGHAPRGRSPRALARFQALHVIPLREAAREVTRLLIADGFVRPRPGACESCGAGGKRIVCHHLDWLRPEVIAWLCPRCLAARHASPIDWQWLWDHADHEAAA